MSILAKIKQLRNKGISSDDIEILLLNGKLGKIRIESHGYQFIENFTISWLVIEVHELNFIKWMHLHPGYVVHHKDGNILNNAYENLQVMSRSDHLKLHRNDPKFAEVERVRSEKFAAFIADPKNAEDIKAKGKKHSEWFNDPANAETVKASVKKYLDWRTDPANAETIKVMGEKISVWYKDPVNVKANEDRSKKSSETQRENNDWIDLSIIESPFTLGNYAEVSGIFLSTAWYRLAMLSKEGQITCEKEVIDGRRCNVYKKEIQNLTSSTMIKKDRSKNIK